MGFTIPRAISAWVWSRRPQTKFGSPVDEVLLFCCRYDPATGKYGVIISRIMQISGLMTILFIGGLILSLSRVRHAASGL